MGEGLDVIDAPSDREEYAEPVVDLSEETGEADPEPHTDEVSRDELWGVFGGLLRAHVLMPAYDDVSESMYALERAVEDERRPTAGEVADARRALFRALEFVEDYYAPLAPGTEPWEEGAGDGVPHGALADQLRESGYRVHPPGDRSTDG